MKSDVLIIGGGPAGMIAAITAAENGAKAVVLEPNERLGKKLNITGKGRCNVTNNCTAEELQRNIPQNGRFLFSAFAQFDSQDTMAFFERLGVPLKTERGNRVFPVSDRAFDISGALEKQMKRLGVAVIRDRAMNLICDEASVLGARGEKGDYYAAANIVATGGLSYPLTGSTGDGYKFAEETGHTVVTPRGSLVPLEEKGSICRELMGLSLRNVGLTVLENDKKLYSDFGEMLFTHFGVSGPLILSASSHMRHFGKKEYALRIDLKPALDEQTLDKRLLSDFEKHINSDFINALGDLLPQKFIPVYVKMSGVDPHIKVHSIAREQRKTLVNLLKAFPVEIRGPRSVSEAIITSGGVKVSEVNPSTMASKKMSGLYFAGEVLDVDAYTGGFNLQIAWSTGFVAGQNAAWASQE